MKPFKLALTIDRSMLRAIEQNQLLSQMFALACDGPRTAAEAVISCWNSYEDYDCALGEFLYQSLMNEEDPDSTEIRDLYDIYNSNWFQLFLMSFYEHHRSYFERIIGQRLLETAKIEPYYDHDRDDIIVVQIQP